MFLPRRISINRESPLSPAVRASSYSFKPEISILLTFRMMSRSFKPASSADPPALTFVMMTPVFSGIPKYLAISGVTSWAVMPNCSVAWLPEACSCGSFRSAMTMGRVISLPFRKTLTLTLLPTCSFATICPSSRSSLTVWPATSRMTSPILIPA